MGLADMILWPGTKICEKMGIDPSSDAGLIRWMINTLIYLVLALVVVWIAVV